MSWLNGVNRRMNTTKERIGELEDKLKETIQIEI